jgi:hypothetical protein
MVLWSKEQFIVTLFQLKIRTWTWCWSFFHFVKLTNYVKMYHVINWPFSPIIRTTWMMGSYTHFSFVIRSNLRALEPTFFLNLELGEKFVNTTRFCARSFKFNRLKISLINGYIFCNVMINHGSHVLDMMQWYPNVHPIIWLSGREKKNGGV